jgi:hypothetical protein
MAQPGWSTISTSGICNDRATVIMENGRLVGTQIVAKSERSDAAATTQRAGAPITARLRAGVSQTLHELRLAVPANLSAPGERERFHESLVEKIGDQK